MKKRRFFQAALAWLAVAGMCAPQLALAAMPNAQNPMVSDVVLRDGGVLLGQVVQPNGTPLANVPVLLRSGNQELASGNTNMAGYFAFSGLRNGNYQVVSGANVGTYQVWTADLAPPGAQPGAVIVSGSDTVRGQQPGPLQTLFSRPLLLGGLIAAAIAIPIAVSQSHRSTPSGP